MSILRGGQAVDDFVEGAVAAAGDHESAAVLRGFLGDFGGVPGAGGFGKFGLDTVFGKEAARVIEQAAATIAAIAGVWIVNQERVLNVRAIGDG